MHNPVSQVGPGPTQVRWDTCSDILSGRQPYSSSLGVRSIRVASLVVLSGAREVRLTGDPESSVLDGLATFKTPAP